MGDLSDHMEWAAGRTSWQEDLVPGLDEPRTRTKSRGKWPEGLKVFAENYSAFFKLQSVKNYPGESIAKFTFDTRLGDQYTHQEIAKILARVGATFNIYGDTYQDRIRWLKVSFPSTSEVVEDKYHKQGTKKMNEDQEFYLALLQSSGVKMVSVKYAAKQYSCLCAIKVVEGDNVVVQARDRLVVGTVTKVHDDWDMEIVDELGGDLKWVINTVDISNAKVYEDQKKLVFRELRQSRLVEKARKFAGNSNSDFDTLVEKARKFAGNSNIDFDTLVQKSQDALAIEHTSKVG